MNISGITSKITSNAELLGVAAALLPQASMDGIISSIQQLAAGVIHAPNVSSELQLWFMADGKNTITAWVAGLLIDALNVPFIGKYGNALQKAAIGYGAATLGNRLLYGATHSEIKGYNIENSRSVQQNFASAPLVSSYQY